MVDAFPAVLGKKFWPRFRWVVGVLTLFVLIRTSAVDVCNVPSRSMLPTLFVGDRVLVNKLAYGLRAPLLPWQICSWAAPRRGDVVIFVSPRDGLPLVKRVIGLPGDEVELRQGVLWINRYPAQYRTAGGVRSEAIADRLPSHPLGPDHPRHDSIASMPAVKVPPEHLFVLGDNRDESFDSRYLGFIDQRRLVGKAELIVLSLDDKGWLRRGRALVRVR